jgi:hypothetical protein
MPDKDREPTVFVVSNRLPVTIRQSEDGQYDVAPSSGGLVGALHGLSQTTKFKWYGWPGLEVPEQDKDLVKDHLSKRDAVPVFLNTDVADKHYNGFSSCLPIIVVSSRRLANFTLRQDSVATLTLSDARDSPLPARLGIIPRSKPMLCRISRSSLTRRRLCLDTRLSPFAFALLPTSIVKRPYECPDRILLTHCFPRKRFL